MFLQVKLPQLRQTCAAGCSGALSLRSSKYADQPELKLFAVLLMQMKRSILGFELGRPVRQSMEDVTVGEPKVSDGIYGEDISSQGFDQNISSVPIGHSNLDQHICQQRVALFDIMATCGYLL